MNTVRNDSDVNVNACADSCQHHLRTRRMERLASVFQLIGSTKPFTTSAISSAPTRARPTFVGSRFMHVSHTPHWCDMAGMGLVAQRLVLYCMAHCAISWTISVAE